MSLLRPFTASDLFSFNSINLDVWTETYGVSYYLTYLAKSGDLFSYVLYICLYCCFFASVDINGLSSVLLLFFGGRNQSC